MQLPPEAGDVPVADRDVSAGPKVRALSEGEEQGIAKLDELQTAIHGPDYAPRGNGLYQEPQAASALDDFDKFSALMDEPVVGSPEIGQFGGIYPTLAAHAGGAVAGATYGAATGDTPEERIQRALAFGAGGALLPSLVSRPGAAQTATRIGANRRQSLGRVGPLESSVRGVPPSTPIPAKRLLEFPSLEKQPEDVRREIAGLLEKHGGFASQRRNVQPWERTEKLSEGIRLPLEKLKPGTALNAEELAAYRDAVASVMSKRQPLVGKIESGAATHR
jgi:hypothetical protein